MQLPAVLNLATYNIHACIGMDGHFNPQRISAVLREIDADIVALQEVDHHIVANLDLLDYLAEANGYQPIAGPTLLRGTRYYGNAILTRLPVKDIKRIDLSFHRYEPRGAIQARFQVGQFTLRVVATHLGLRPAERRHQVKHLLKMISPQVPDIDVLMGDLNEWLLWGRPLRWLRRHFSPQPHLRTYPACWPCLALDRIWIAPGQFSCYLSVHETPLARIASDHRPLVASIWL
ncbi:endonuclease/exonuclease/phosphatase family protein [Nitrosomonas sp. ANs5]|uniref:endonuclease/exonuclease/phosphatase family protein n=1 Tax=Nitrosomonas sp. ANs5 TaxID=3423941 RepID=UPI003D33E95E